MHVCTSRLNVGIAVITRDTIEVVVEGQVVDGSTLKLTLVQMTREIRTADQGAAGRSLSRLSLWH